MFLQLQQHSVLIGKRPTGFTEHYYTEWDDGLGKEKIILFMVMGISSTQVPGAEIGREAFQLLQDHFLRDLSGDAYARFESALREINTVINKQEKELGAKFIPNVSVLIGVVQGGVLYLSQRGEAQGYLVRKRHVSTISEGLCDEKNKEDLFQNIASGELEVGDTVILSTGQLIQFVTPSDLSKIYSEQSVVEANAELKDLLHTDLEDQLGMLTFEVLEKSEDMPALMEETPELDPEEISEQEQERESRIKESLQVLRNWIQEKRRSEWLKKLPVDKLPLGKLKGLSQKQLLSVIVGTVVVLVLGITLLTLTTGKQRQLDQMEAKLALAEENVTQASTRGSFDKSEATELLDEAEDIVVEVLDSGVLGGEASALMDEISEQRDFLDNVIRVEDDQITELTDLTALNGEPVLALVPYEDRSILFTKHNALEVLIDEAGTPIVVDAENNIVAAQYFADRNNVVVLTDKGGLIEYTDGNAQFADTADGEWKSGLEVHTYSSRVYILDSVNNQIWRYQRGNSGFGAAGEYAAASVDLSKVVSMTIDGSVWTLDSDGVIGKLLSGKTEEFEIHEAPLVSFAGATKIVTDLESTKLYVLDPERERVLVFDKSSTTGDLIYSTQYVFESIKDPVRDFYFDREKNTLVLATDKALYELSF